MLLLLYLFFQRLRMLLIALVSKQHSPGFETFNTITDDLGYRNHRQGEKSSRYPPDSFPDNDRQHRDQCVNPDLRADNNGQKDIGVDQVNTQYGTDDQQ